MKKLKMLNLGKGLSRMEMKFVNGGSLVAEGVQCCKSGVCGTCVTTNGGGIATCSAGYTLSSCTIPVKSF